jgi:hypothetical protein
VIRRRRAGEAVDALSHAFKHGLIGEPLQGCRRDARVLGLATSQQAPLILGDSAESIQSCVASDTAI